MDELIMITKEEYEELLRNSIEKVTILKMIRRDYSEDKQSCYRNCIDILEMFDYEGDYEL